MLSCFLIFQLSAFGVVAAVASSELPQATSGYYPSKIRLSASGSTEERGIFYVDYLLPLYYFKDQSTLLFFNPKQNLYTPSAEETNLGLGLRKIFSDKFILGTHFFFDRKFAHSNKLYSQVGAGFEFLSKPFDFRFNYYDPTTKAKVVDESHEFGSTTLVNVKNMEEPLGGYDFEFGFPVLPKKLNTRLYLGGFFFNSRIGKDNNGCRIRSETNLTNWFALETTFNSRNAQETEFIGGIRITIPFGSSKATARQDPSKIIPTDFYIQDRLLERVVRDIDVQSSSVSKKEDVAGISMIYVDNTKPAGGDGSLEHPYNTLQGALSTVGAGAGSGKRIYVFRGDGTNTGYKSSSGYTLVDDLILWGSGYNGGYKGLPVTTGYPMIDANSSAVNPVLILANNNTVMGLDLEHGKYGIYELNKSGASILYNNIANTSNSGIYVQNATSSTFSDFTFTGNTLTGNGGTAGSIAVWNSTNGTISDFTLTNNTITGSTEDGIYVVNSTTGTISGFTFTGNSITANSKYGVCLYNVAGGAMSDFTFNDNTITKNGWYGVNVYNAASGTFSDFTFTGNTMTGNSYHGIGVINALAGTFSDFTFTGNTATGNTMHGIYLCNSAAGTFSDFIFTSNAITGNTRNGIYLVKGTGSMSGINLGDGALGGNNSIYNNGNKTTYFDINNASGVNGLLAQYNWWGQDANPSSQISGSVVYDPWLHSSP